MEGTTRRTLLGIMVLAVLLILGVAVLVGLTRNAQEEGDEGSEVALGRLLAKELGVEADVAFLCRLPVVGVAPCVLGKRTGSREVRLAFLNHELPEGVTPEEHAQRIALMAHKAAAFAREADSIEVIFEQRGELSSVVRSYSYPTERLEVDARDSR